jgi:hypothetical protein
MCRQRYRFSTLAAVTGLLAAGSVVQVDATGVQVTASQDKAAQDQIEVVGHIALSGGNGSPVTGFLTTQHYNRSYLYVERAGAKVVTLIDVTKADRPSVIADVAGNGLVSVAGTAALVTQESPRAASRPESLRIMNFADIEHPQIVREFTGVTAVARDDRRGLIFLANGDGVWILRQQLAEDPAMVRAYDDYVRYYR